jgi:hypothetical protein
MSEESEAIKESAKAAQEIAKTTRQAIDAGQQFGGFISRFISGPLEQGMGIFEDKLKYMRWERQMRLMERANEYIQSLGIEAPTNPIPLKLAVPLFQAASLEDDNYLQDMWARLLVNSSFTGSNVDLKRSYIDILERLSNIEAKILETIYSLPKEAMAHKGILTAGLPDSVEIEEENNKNEPVAVSDEVTLALANLSRLGCITLPTTWGGGEIFTSVFPTLMGRTFFEACTLNAPNEI